MAGGLCMVFVVVVGIVLVLLYLPRPITRQILRCAALLIGGLVIATLLRAILVNAPGWVFLFLFLWVVGILIIWIFARVVRQGPPAAAVLSCPQIGHLKDWLAERLRPREHARLAAHLEVCPACQHRVEGLTAGQGSWVGMARKLNQRPSPAEPALREVMEKLKGDQVPEPTSDNPAFAGDLPLGFLAPSDKPGQLGRLERYEVLEEVGRGGMGVVLKAFDPSLHRVVAIKVLAPQLATSGVARKRFLREAKAAAAVSHDHIVTIHAVDEANGLPYLVMQYVAGLSLQDRLDREGPIGDLAEVLRIGMQTASGLAAAHAHGIVHRDVKPGNILLEEGVGRVKLTDFGLARAMDDASLTQSGFVAGSPLYMAPEQARGEGLDHRADLFSLGSVLYTMCTGRPPFRAANTLAVLRRVCDDVARPIRETNPEIPDWLAAAVEKLMAKEPGDRFQSADEVVELLGRHLAEIQHGVPVPPPAVASIDTAGLPTSLTICPSCGASLHVPERMVGKVVHCAECGKAFPVEQASEEILVARAVPSPFGQKVRAHWKLPRWIWVLGGCAVLMFLVIVLFGLSASGPHHSFPAHSTLVPQGTTKAEMPTNQPPFWKSTLDWLPPEATLFGAVNLEKFGSLHLGDEWTQTALRLALPAEVADKVTPEKLGRIRIDRVSLGLYEDRKTAEPRTIVQLEGLALDGRRRVLDFIRETAPGPVLDEKAEKRWLAGRPVGVSSPNLPFAVGLYDDHRLFLGRSLKEGSKEAQHRKALELHSWFAVAGTGRPQGGLLTGYNPPWVQMALQNIPSDACGLFLGEIPAGWRKQLIERLDLRECPRTFVCHLKREGDTLAVSLTLNLARPGREQILVAELEKLRRHGIDVLQGLFPALLREPQALASVRQYLTTLRWQANLKNGSVRTTLRIPRQTRKALGTLLKRVAGLGAEGQKR